MKRSLLIAGVLSFAVGIAANLVRAEPTMTVELPIARPLAVAYSPDGRQVAVGGLESYGDVPIDGVVQLVDAATGAKQSLLRNSGRIVDKDGSGSSSSQNRIRALAYSADGQTLAVASDLGLKLWNSANGEELATILGYGIDDKNRRVEVTSVAFSPDGKLLAVARSPIELWDAIARKPLRQIEIHGDADVKFFQDGSQLASASYQNEVHLWNVADGKELGRVHAEMGPLYAVAIDPQDKVVAAVGEGGEKLWRIDKQAVDDWRFVDEARLSGHSMSAVRHVAFSPDGRILATAGDDGALVIYGADTRQTVGTLLAGGPFDFSADGRSVAVAHVLDDRSSGTRIPGVRAKGGTRFAVWKLDDLLDADRLAEQARTAATEMVQTLESPRPDRRLMQGVVAVLSGPQAEEATPILVEALANPSVNEQHLLVIPLGRIAAQDAQARTALIEALRTATTVDVRSMAAAMLAQLPPNAGKEAVPALVEAVLNDDSPHVSSSAARALQRLDPAAYKTVAEQMQARGPAAAKVERRDGRLFYQGRSLEEWIKRLSVSYIPNEIFGRPRPDEPLAAIRAIGTDAVPVLIEMLESDQWPMRQAAAAGLKALGPQAVDPVYPLLGTIAAAQEVELGAAGRAADAIAGILKDRKEPWPQLAAMTNSEEPVVRLSAARAVAQIDSAHPRGLPVLTAALEATSSEAGLYPTMHAPMKMAPFRDTKQPSISWLEKTLTDEESPTIVRIKAASTLGSMKEEALPALSSMVQAIAAKDPNVGYQTIEAIINTGPKAVPEVRNALRAESNVRTRMRLAVTLWRLGDEGQHALKELLQGDDAEPLWWSMVVAKHDLQFAINFQHAAGEALKKCGQEVTPWQEPQGIKDPRAASSVLEEPNVAWSMKVVADREAPRSLRRQAAGALRRAPNRELRPLLPALLAAIEKEEDSAMQSEFTEVIQRMRPESIPAITAAIEASSSDKVRRVLLKALIDSGKEGQQEVERLKQLHPEFSKLVVATRGEQAMAATERIHRLFTNFDRYTAFHVATAAGDIPPAVTMISLRSVRCFLISQATGHPTYTPDSLHQCSGAHPLPDGTRVKWSCRTKNGRDFTQITIGSVTYDLAKGRVFLLARKEKAVDVHQVATGTKQADGSGMQELKNLEKSHPEIRDFCNSHGVWGSRK